MVWGAIIGAAVSAYSAYESSRQQKEANKKANAALLAQTAAGQAILDKRKGAALSFQQKGITFADESFEKAIGTAGQIGQASRGLVLRREKEFRGAADARAADRGLYDSTAALNDQRGVFESTNTTLAGIDEAIAGLLTQIHQGRGAAALQGYSNMAAIEQNFAFQQAGIATQNQHMAADVASGWAQASASLSKLLMTYNSGGWGNQKQASAPGWWADAEAYADAGLGANLEDYQ